MIRIDGLVKRYGAFTALDGVTLHVPQGELFAYLGPNGAGKSTTIRILTGLTRHTGGNASLGGYDIASQPIDAKHQCGVVMQHINLDNELTLRQNMEIHGRLFQMSSDLRKSRTHELLDYVGLLDRLDKPINSLSGGMKRRLTIARALMHKPSILFLDEPTVGLDPDIRRKIWALIKQIQNDGTTVFLTTHYIEEAEFLADRVAFLDHGRICALDTPKALISKVGCWAFDSVDKGVLQTKYYETRQQAQDALKSDEAYQTLRRVSLEDAFLTFTGQPLPREMGQGA